MKKILLLFLSVFLTVEISLSQEIKSPAKFLGYEIGEHFTRHADVVDYFSYVAENSPLVNYHTYGKTNERRPLTYAVISSEENLQNIEQIRKDHLTSAGLMEGQAQADDKAVVWLSYNVHGNEASSTEAAMKTLYELITSRKDLLENTVVI
ncbi:MAG: M14 family zinc carboxypeptidase, partial [Salegentibacter sp.]